MDLLMVWLWGGKDRQVYWGAGWGGAFQRMTILEVNLHVLKVSPKLTAKAQ